MVISTSLSYDDNPYVDDENGENDDDTCNDDAGSIWLGTVRIVGLPQSFDRFERFLRQRVFFTGFFLSPEIFFNQLLRQRFPQMRFSIEF